MKSTKCLLIVLHKSRFSQKRNIAFLAALKRKLAGKGNQVAGNTRIHFVGSFVKRCILYQVHVHMIFLNLNTQKTLNNGGITNNR